jgi:hypothetical protein
MADGVRVAVERLAGVSAAWVTGTSRVAEKEHVAASAKRRNTIFSTGSPNWAVFVNWPEGRTYPDSLIFSRIDSLILYEQGVSSQKGEGRMLLHFLAHKTFGDGGGGYAVAWCHASSCLESAA